MYNKFFSPSCLGFGENPLGLLLNDSPAVNMVQCSDRWSLAPSGKSTSAWVPCSPRIPASNRAIQINMMVNWASFSGRVFTKIEFMRWYNFLRFSKDCFCSNPRGMTVGRQVNLISLDSPSIHWSRDHNFSLTQWRLTTFFSRTFLPGIFLTRLPKGVYSL